MGTAIARCSCTMKHSTSFSDFATISPQALSACTGGDGGNDAQRGYGSSAIPLGTLGHLVQTGPSDNVKCGTGKKVRRGGGFAESGSHGLSAGGVPIAAPIAVCPRIPRFGR
jgi:hypothetical protein